MKPGLSAVSGERVTTYKHKMYRKASMPRPAGSFSPSNPNDDMSRPGLDATDQIA